MRSLCLGGFACLVKDLNRSGSHQHNPLNSPWYREDMFDLSPQSPLSAINRAIGSRNAMHVNVSTDPSNPNLQGLSVGGNPTCYIFQLVVV